MSSSRTFFTRFIHGPGQNTQNIRVSEAQKNAIKAVFDESDLENKGYLSREDIKVACVSLFGYKPSKYEVNEMLGIGDNKESGVDLEQFVELMSHKMAAQDEDDLIRQTFLSFDLQCKGFLTVEDLKKVMTQVAPHMHAHTIESAFREVDRDGDGRVSYKDFEFMMKYNHNDGF